MKTNESKRRRRSKKLRRAFELLSLQGEIWKQFLAKRKKTQKIIHVEIRENLIKRKKF